MNIQEIDRQLQALEENEKLSFTLGKKTYRIARLGNWTSRRINKLLYELRRKKIETPEDILSSDDDRKLVAQVVAIAILRFPWRIKLFHWYLWRKLDRKYSQEDFAPIISVLIENSDMGFFSKNLASLHAAASMETMMTKETITNIAAKLNSEQETTSSSPSTGKSRRSRSGNTGSETQS